jgi:hypothetical protein
MAKITAKPWKVGDRVVNRPRGFHGTVSRVGDGYVLVVGDGHRPNDELALRVWPDGTLADDNGVIVKRDLRRRR